MKKFASSSSLVAALCFVLSCPLVAQEPLLEADAALQTALREVVLGDTLGPRDVVGEEIRLTTVSPAIGPRGPRHSEAGLGETTEEPVWREALEFPGASYIAPYFGRMDLPAGSRLVVRSPDGSRSWTYQGTGKGTMGIEDGFWGIHIVGDRAVLELYADGPVPEGAVIVDRFARGFDLADFGDETGGGEAVGGEAVGDKSICGSDNSAWARCYTWSRPTHYSKSRAVARLLINGTSACTGWLVGAQGHLMTAHHCIHNQAEANNVNYEMMAEGTYCSTNCSGWMSCPGSVVATSATVVQTNPALDYMLLKLPTNPSGTYGYLKLRNEAPSVNQDFYIPQHPAGKGKRLAIASTHPADNWGECEISSTTVPSIPQCQGATVGHYCDTLGSSSGAPMIEDIDHTVVAMHTCGSCAPNSGVPAVAIVADLSANDNLPYLGVFNVPQTCSNKCKEGIACTSDCQCGPGTCFGGTCNCEI